MAEVLTNGTFDSDLSSWSKHGGSSTNMFVYDATGAAHDGGAAKCTNDGDPYETMRFSMKQAFTMTYASDIDTAVVDAWTQWNDAWPAANAEVSKSWVKFWVQLQDPDSNWHTVASAKHFYGSLTAHTLCDEEDVKSILTAGGNGTWYFGVTCDIYRANLSTGWFVGWFDDLGLDIAYHDYGSNTETITLTDTTSSGVLAASDTDTDTITLSDSGVLSMSSDNTTGFYLGSYDGKVYYESSDYKSDGGTSIDAFWESKETDFAEEGMEAHNKFKTIHKVRLWYVDVSDSSAVVTVKIKPDGGTTWTSISENVGGSGNDTNKYKDFHIIITGHSFKFRVEHDSGNNTFQWSGLEVLYALGGDSFQ